MFFVRAFLFVALTVLAISSKGLADTDIYKDSATGCLWQDTSENKFLKFSSGDKARAYCHKLRLSGHNDWRLPDLDEIKTIQKATETKKFKNFRDDAYWFGGADMLNNYGVYDFYTKEPLKNTKKTYARCIRNTKKKGIERLMVIKGVGNTYWSNFGNDFKYQKMPFQEAKAYCENLVQGGYDNWRLPTIWELSGAIDLSKYNPASSLLIFEKQDFNSILGPGCWSSTQRASINDPKVLIVYFKDGSISDSSLEDRQNVRCIRGDK